MVIKHQRKIVLKRCPVCDSRSMKILFSARDLLLKKHGTFNVEECKTCHYRFTNPQPLPEDMLDYYTPDYPSYQAMATTVANANDKEVTIRLPALQSLSSVRKYSFYGGFWGSRAWVLPDFPQNSKVLELGCGQGNFIRQCVARGWETVGTDLNPD